MNDVLRESASTGIYICFFAASLFFNRTNPPFDAECGQFVGSELNHLGECRIAPAVKGGPKMRVKIERSIWILIVVSAIAVVAAAAQAPAGGGQPRRATCAAADVDEFFLDGWRCDTATVCGRDGGLTGASVDECSHGDS
jgi:hypothetical protein